MRGFLEASVMAIMGFGLIAPPAMAAGNSLNHLAPQYVFDHWDTERGLPQNEVTAIIQTRDGYLWLGTPSGLVRFDGIQFKRYDESDTAGLNSSRISSLFEDSRQNLWVGTESAGVALFKNGRATRVDLGNDSHEQRLASACEDPSGAVWLYLSSGQLWKYDKGKTALIRTAQEQPSDYRSIISDKSGLLWLGTDSGITGLDSKIQPTVPNVPLFNGPPLAPLNLLLSSREGGYWALAADHIYKWSHDPSSTDSKTYRPETIWAGYPWHNFQTPISAACEDQQGRLIVGTRNAGLFWFDTNGSAVGIDTTQGLSSDHILALCADRDGNLWVGTDGGGLNRITRPIFDLLEESRGAVVQSVSADKDGGLWIGFNERAVSYRSGGAVREYSRRFDRYVRTVFVDREQRVWGGTWGAGLVHFQNGQFELAWNSLTITNAIDQHITVVHEDRRGHLWVGTQRDLAEWDAQAWKVFTSRDGLPQRPIQAITDDSEGNLWIGTAGGGLAKRSNGGFQSIRKADGNLPSDYIACLYVDKQGVLWVGTDGAGLARVAGGKWTRYTRRDGLVSNTITYVIEDDQNFLWIGSNSGLMRAPEQALSDFASGVTNFVSCRVYGRIDGLPTRECTMGSSPGAWRTPDGKLWFATIKGVVSIDPSTMKRELRPPPVMIESIIIDGETRNDLMLPHPGTRPYSLSARTEHLEIQYSSLNLAGPERTRFRYWLKGYETEWTDAGSSSVAHYTKLPPGNYDFYVTACNADGIWNENAASLSFVVLPPFWQTGWFLGTTTAILLGTMTALVHYLSTQKLQRQLAVLKQQDALEKERSRIARDIHDQLGASLTQVALLGELVEGDKDAPSEVEAHARQISQTARDTTRVLDEIVWAVNPANDTLDGLMTYICKYAQEYLAVAGIHYRFDVPSELPDTSIPPDIRHNVFLTCKEAITNVVRHAQATEVRVRLGLEGNAFVIEIEDNGRGLAGLDEKAARTRNGLRNMEKRMESVGGEFAFGPALERGTLIRLRTPFPSRSSA